MPVIFETNEQVRDWLNFVDVISEDALRLIRKSENYLYVDRQVDDAEEFVKE